jgi:hypothetical protein
VLEHPFSCRSPYQHCPQIVGSCSAVRSSTEPWFIKSSGPQRNRPGSTAHLQPTETLYATCSLLSRGPCKKKGFVEYVLQRKVSGVCVVVVNSLRTSNVKCISWRGVTRAHCIRMQPCSVVALQSASASIGLRVDWGAYAREGCVAKIWKAGLVPDARLRTWAVLCAAWICRELEMVIRSHKSKSLDHDRFA